MKALSGRELLGLAVIGLIVTPILLVAGCREKDGEVFLSSTGSKESSDHRSADPITILTHVPIQLLPGVSRGYYLCAILGRSLRLWRDKGKGDPPLTVFDLWERGYLLWDLRDLKWADPGSLRAGDARYNSRLLSDPKGTGERVGVAFACFATAGLQKTPVESQMEYWIEPGAGGRGDPPDSSAGKSETEMTNYLSQARTALALYYFLRNEKAPSRTALEQVMGRESPAWKDPALSAVLETLIKEHTVLRYPDGGRAAGR
jgi:hypothetical protein